MFDALHRETAAVQYVGRLCRPGEIVPSRGTTHNFAGFAAPGVARRTWVKWTTSRSALVLATKYTCHAAVTLACGSTRFSSRLSRSRRNGERAGSPSRTIMERGARTRDAHFSGPAGFSRDALARISRQRATAQGCAGWLAPQGGVDGQHATRRTLFLRINAPRRLPWHERPPSGRVRPATVPGLQPCCRRPSCRLQRARLALR